MSCRIAVGHTEHARHGRAGNRFRYPALCLFFRTDQEAELHGALSKKYRGALSFRGADYLEKSPGLIDTSIRHFLHDHCAFVPDNVWLMTMPRMFGYAFNPVSFWLCERGGKLAAALCEVNNTFGERHFYWVNAPSGLLGEWHTAKKAFHVSPFLPVEGYYRFYFRRDETALRVDVNYFDAEEKLTLSTWIETELLPPEKLPLLRLLARFGWITPLVVFRIHYQALRLWWKGAPFHRKPQLPHDEVSV